MKISKLPPQLVSLVHHIALNEIGWWDKTIQRIIIASIWLSEKSIANKENIRDSINSNFGLNLSHGVIDEQIKILVSSSVLVEYKKDFYKISESELSTFKQELSICEAIEQKAKEKFTELCNSYCKDLDHDEQWNIFNEELINPLVYELGAKAYELISDRDGSVEQIYNFQKYLQKFPIEIQPDLKKIIVEFLDPKEQDTREFVLSKINAYFCIESGNLSADALQKLVKITKKKLFFNIFVDTNFLFSILELHENPSNEAAQSLLALIKDISNIAEVKLFAAPITIKEATNVISFHMNFLKDIRITENLKHAFKNIEFSGFARKYFSECEKTNKQVSAEQYFSPYINNFIPVIRSKGVEFFNRNLDKYTTDQRVIDDLNDRLTFEQKVFKEKAKTYEQLLHDIVLWHFIKDGRPAIIESPADCKNWIVTIDFRFLGFDAYKRKDATSFTVPICIHPTTLIQILQFWVPRTKEFEEAVMSNLRYPFLFHEFDTASERITLKILGTLSRYEEFGDLPVETITSILLNDALRGKINSTKDIQEQIELVKDTIISELKRIKGASGIFMDLYKI